MRSYTLTLSLDYIWGNHTIIHSSNLTLFQFYTLSILHSSYLALFQSYTLTLLHSSNLTLFQYYTLWIWHSNITTLCTYVQQSKWTNLEKVRHTWHTLHITSPSRLTEILGTCARRSVVRTLPCWLYFYIVNKQYFTAKIIVWNWKWFASSRTSDLKKLLS